MSKKSTTYPNPKFASPEEEAEFWTSHSPLLDGYEGKVEKGSEKRTAYLSLRMSGKEIELLRQAAIKQGVGPTTLARQLILRGMAARAEAKGLGDRVSVLEQKLKELETAAKQG